MMVRATDAKRSTNSDDGDGVTDGQEKQMQQIPMITAH
jgi:hypothetical protein